MKSMIQWLTLLLISGMLVACGSGAEGSQAPGQQATEAAGTGETTAAQPATEGATETEEEAATETTGGETETGAATEGSAATEKEVESGRITNYEVDFSDVDGIRAMTTGHGEDKLLVLAVVSNEEEPEQEVVVYQVDNGQKTSLFQFFIPDPLEFIGAVTADDDKIYFTGVDRTDENTVGSFAVYRVDMKDQEVHTLYRGEADALNYGQNLAADDDAVFFTENMWEQDGLYFADVVMVQGDAKQVISVDVFPSEQISLLVDDDKLVYAAARDDEQFIIEFDYKEEARSFQVAGDNANFRLTDVEDGRYLLDSYNGHPDQRNAMILRVHRDSGEIMAFSQEGRNLHTAIFADNNGGQSEDDDRIVAVSSAGEEIRWVETDADDTAPLQEIAGEMNVPAGAALIGVFEEEDEVIRYPKAISEAYYFHFTLVYQVYR